MQEEWRPVPDFPDYQVSNHGRIMNRFREIRRTSINQADLDVIVFSKNGVHYARSLHKLVAEVFLGEVRKGVRAVHIDGNRRNNRADNLEWMSARRSVLLHRQSRRLGPIDPRGVILVETGTRFRDARECGRELRIPEEEILEYAEATERGIYKKLYHRGNAAMVLPPGTTQVRFTE